jgi:glycosyltransferase involved in cell wall biosynthesis
MKLMAFPYDDGNPYQRLLYGQMQELGTRVSYLGRLTPSCTLNLLLLPLEVAVRRAAGTRLVHLHWVFGFSFPGAERLPVMRRLAQIWFALWLRTARLLGVHVVWTAHNVLPHAPVFADDAAARRALVAASDLVIAHSESALTGLAALGAVPRASVVIPHGPLAAVPAAASLPVPGSRSGPRHILFFGKILEYKGTEDLISAFAALPAGTVADLTVAGQCDDPTTTTRLRALARAGGQHVTLRLERIPEPDVGPLLASADAVALPYRRATTSGCAMLALAYGRPLILPELDAFAHLPRAALVSYDGTRQALTSALVYVACADSSALAAMATAARAYAATLSWHDIAVRTRSEMQSVAGRAGAGPGHDEALTGAEAARKSPW